MPTVLASGRICCSRSICSATGVRSEEPVTLPPGASLVSTSPEPAGSVTPVRTMGISSVSAAQAWAAGVAMAKIRSSPSLTNFWAMVVQVGVSPAAFC